MNLGRYSAWLALGFAPLLLVQTVLRHGALLNGWVLADTVAGAMLLLAGVWSLRRRSEAAGRWLAGSWGFAAGMLLIALLALTPCIDAAPPREGEAGWVVMAGWLLITAAIGFAGAVAGNQNARR